MFTIETDSRRRLVIMKLTGMLTVDDVTDLYRREHDAIRAMGCPLGEQLVLVDVTECPLQLQDIVAAFQRSMDSHAKGKRVAMVTGSSLARMQVRRIMRRDASALFNSRAEALAWLLDESEERRAA